MRLLGKIVNLEQATLLAEYLNIQGIEVAIEQAEDGAVVWVRDEDHVPRAQHEFLLFVKNPQDPVYEATLLHDRQQQSKKSLARASHPLKTAKRSATARHASLEPPVKEKDDSSPMLQRSLAARAPLTVVLVTLSLLVALMINQASLSSVKRGLSFWDTAHQVDEQWERNRNGWDDIARRGQVWRLITPSFLHQFSGLLVFNLILLFFLGSLVESRYGTLRVAIIVLAAAIAGNIGEYTFGQQPEFGGISGVVFGLFGYACVNSMLDPDSKVRIPPVVVIGMIVWLGLGFTDVLDKHHMHLFGLLTGIVIAALAGMFKRQEPKIA